MLVLSHARTGFYPYLLVNIDNLGVLPVAVNVMGVIALLVAVGAIYWLFDWLIDR